MKKRRIAIAAFLLCAVLVMGVGFAAVADNLNISGAARATSDQTATVFDDRVKFTNAVRLSGNGSATGTDTIEITGTQQDAIEFHVNTLALINEQTTFKITITNSSKQYDAIISLDDGMPSGVISNPAGTDLSKYFSIVYSTKNGEVIDAPIRCYSERTVDVYVTISLTSSPDTTVDASFNCNLTATSAEKQTPPTEG